MSAMSAGWSLGQAFVGDLELDAARRIGLEQIDELPRDDARRNPLEQRAQRECRHDALGEAAGSRRARRRPPTRRSAADVAVDRRRVELDVVDADDLPAVHVDDLLIEEVALEKEDAVRRRDARSQLAAVGIGADARAARFQRRRPAGSRPPLGGA